MAEHPITPPPELVEQWHVKAMKGFRANGVYGQDIATQAARWGADQELEACCKWLPKSPPWIADDLRRHRRPKPPSLKVQALEALEVEDDSMPLRSLKRAERFALIRRALEALPE